MKGARHSGVLLGKTADKNSSDVSDIVIEDSDISAWGTDDPRCEGKRVIHGTNLHAAVYSFSDRLQRVVIQRNKLPAGKYLLSVRVSSTNWDRATVFVQVVD